MQFLCQFLWLKVHEKMLKNKTIAFLDVIIENNE